MTWSKNYQAQEYFTPSLWTVVSCSNRSSPPPLVDHLHMYGKFVRPGDVKWDSQYRRSTSDVTLCDNCSIRKNVSNISCNPRVSFLMPHTSLLIFSWRSFISNNSPLGSSIEDPVSRWVVTLCRISMTVGRCCSMSRWSCRKPGWTFARPSTGRETVLRRFCRTFSMARRELHSTTIWVCE